MIDVVFLILIYFIVSMEMEPSLDDIIHLPPVFHAVEQDTSLLQIYVLPAKVGSGGRIVPDSTGLIAFSDKATTPAFCPQCSLRIKDQRGYYIEGSLLDKHGKPVVKLQERMAEAYSKGTRPPAFFCSRCGEEISPYVNLDKVPRLLRARKKEVVKELVASENAKRANEGKPKLTEVEIERLRKNIKLMIKADNKAFYGRILQVVNMAKDTMCDIQRFAFVTKPEASKEAKSSINEESQQ